MDGKTLEALDRQYVMQTYARFPVAFDHGNGATLYDVDGKEYIDFASGLGVSALGYGSERWVNAIAQQIVKLGHSSNLFYSAPDIELAQTLVERAGMSNVCFVNSGAEANEAMIKLARKYSFDKYGKGRGTILTLENSSHGRTVATLSASGQEALHNYFFPLADGFRYAEATLDGVAAVAGHDVCAVMLELVQGAGGVFPMDRGFVHDLAILCAERDWLLLIDEVETGIGRTGTLFAYQQYGVLPDAVTFAKGIAGGLPLGGVMANEKCREVFSPGDHASTFGGNPVCAAAAKAVVDAVSETFLAQVREKGDYLRARIDGLELPGLGQTRGLGLMIGVEVAEGFENQTLCRKLLENGLITLPAGGNSLRLLPPLTITKEEMDRGLTILQTTLEAEA